MFRIRLALLFLACFPSDNVQLIRSQYEDGETLQTKSSTDLNTTVFLNVSLQGGSSFFFCTRDNLRSTPLIESS